MVLDASSNLYIGEGFNVIRRVTVPGFVVTTPYGSLDRSSGHDDGVGNETRFSGPGYVAISANGTLYGF